MLSRILGMHSEVFTFHELHFFEQLWSEKDREREISREEATVLHAKLLKNQLSGIFSRHSYHQYIAEAKDRMTNISGPLKRHEIFKRFLEDEAQLNGCTIPCEQTPRNILFIKEILAFYPKAKMIGMIRDPRDVLLSQKRKWKRKFLGASNIPLRESIRSWVNYHPITISRIWQTNASYLSKYAHNPNLLIVKFEDLVSQPESKVTEICKFLDLEYDPNMLKIPKVGSSSQEDSKEYGISGKPVGGWQSGGLTKSEIYYCQRICASLMSNFNYETMPVSHDGLRKTFDALSFPVKLLMAFVLNIKRMKNMGESLRRRLMAAK